MKIDPTIHAQARLALHEAVRTFLHDPNVLLIDFGHPTRVGQVMADEVAIRFHTRKKLPMAALETAIQAGHTRALLPGTVGAFSTDVLEGDYRAHVIPSWGWWPRPATNPRAKRVEIMCGGISISDENHYTYGTLGGLVFDRESGAEMILSNWHVLAGEWNAHRGQRIYQPGWRDGGTIADTVATLARDAMPTNLDAAVATLNGSRKLINDQMELRPVNGTNHPELGLHLVKSGRSTNVTYGWVTGIEGIGKFFYGRERLERVIRHIVAIEPLQGAEQVSAGGDSGAWWLDSDKMQAIGLHFAGSNLPERALALDMPSVLEALNVDIAPGR